jgi:hypothetical protein
MKTFILNILQELKMKYHFIIFSLVVILFTITANAQTSDDITRSNVLPSRFQKQHMPQTEEMLIKGLKDKDHSIRSISAQNIRDLEFLYPDEPFRNFLTPLMEILKDEKEITEVRVLCAIALDDLHSNKGDKVIKEMSQVSSNQTIKELCKALMVNDQKE